MNHPNDELVDQDTGAILWDVVKHRARARAVREYGTMNPPPRYVRDALFIMREHAFRVQEVRRHQLGLSRVIRGVGPQVEFRSYAPDTTE